MTVQILVGDVRDKLRELEPDSVDCVVCSPPYWGLRSYLPNDHPDKPLEIGLERTLGEHIDVLVDVFREVRRVVKPQAAVWINYGDCYATSPNGRSAADTKAAGNDDRTFRDKPFSTVGPIYPPEPGNPFPVGGRRGGSNAPTGPIFEIDETGRQSRRGGRSQNLHDRKQSPASEGRILAGGHLKPKDLCLIPFRLVIALQEAGWWVRSRCVWGKPNGMPDSSGKYRPSVAHEEIFLLSKSGDLFYDAEAVCAPVTGSTHPRVSQKVQAQAGSTRANAGRKTNGPMRAVVKGRTPGVTPKSAGEDTNVRAKGSFHATTTAVLDTRYLRTYEPDVWHIATAAFSESHFATFPPALVERCLMASCPPGGLVLDPFGGAGTVGMVAEKMDRDSILIELNAESAEIADMRIRNECGMVDFPQKKATAFPPGTLFSAAE